MNQSNEEQSTTQSSNRVVNSSSDSLLEEYGIERDPRFVQARQEAKVIFMYMASTVVFFVGISAWGTMTATGGYSYLFGMPTYFFIIIAGACGFLVIGMLIGLRYIEDASLEAWG